ncbi:YqaJ viral recombinase family protein [Sphingomonas piscis]|uniref:YqaJ viral recombinase family protein n=1 Tax=Sphingomonas piscis TaxID=2714943 RepID=A0A6G7YQS3_9SPHN|nr:YqaJ viral recombinase family protein [Sphingomonas piscis]QIK78868.1 YqaJ viral recombinase family protein [Sphingomonas piscis]QIK79098.1 YqaJ viral recombinase family protein [Sphingomonas piscis]QIK79640.1 YqaJ viral recombinase family protein [Sphingomonas piscis]
MITQSPGSAIREPDPQQSFDLAAAEQPVSAHWPMLGSLGLSPGQLAARRESIGGSDANIILSGDPKRVLELWEQKTGQREPEDLSAKLPVMLGCWTEPFNRQWYEQVSGERVVFAGMTMTCPTYGWRTCTLDGLVERTGAVWEAKHTGAFVKGEEVLERYMPQLQHNMAIARVDRAILSVIYGNHKHEVMEVAADWLYQLDLLEAEEAFWSAVVDGTPPVVVAPPPPPRVFGSREICLQGNNAWAAAADDWLQHRTAARLFGEAASAIKGMVDDDVGRAFGHGVEAKRSKAGALTIRELVP